MLAFLILFVLLLTGCTPAQPPSPTPTPPPRPARTAPAPTIGYPADRDWKLRPELVDALLQGDRYVSEFVHSRALALVGSELLMKSRFDDLSRFFDQVREGGAGTPELELLELYRSMHGDLWTTIPLEKGDFEKLKAQWAQTKDPTSRVLQASRLLSQAWHAWVVGEPVDPAAVKEAERLLEPVGKFDDPVYHSLRFMLACLQGAEQSRREELYQAILASDPDFHLAHALRTLSFRPTEPPKPGLIDPNAPAGPAQAEGDAFLAQLSDEEYAWALSWIAQQAWGFVLPTPVPFPMGVQLDPQRYRSGAAAILKRFPDSAWAAHRVLKSEGMGGLQELATVEPELSHYRSGMEFWTTLGPLTQRDERLAADHAVTFAPGPEAQYFDLGLVRSHLLALSTYDLLARGRFQELEEAARRLQAEPVPLGNGSSLQSVFYEAIGRAREHRLPVPMEAVRAWHEVSQAPVADVFLARALIVAAWDARGSGWAHQVIPEGREAFLAHLREARQVLQGYFEEADSAAARTLSIIVAMGLGEPFSGVEKDFRRGLELAPQDLALHSALAEYLAPRWHGEPGQLEAFAAGFSDETYALLALRVPHGERGEGLADWDIARVQAGLASLDRRYPQSRHFGNQILVLSWRLQDRAAAARAAQGIDGHWDQDVFRNEKLFKETVAWARGD